MIRKRRCPRCGRRLVPVVYGFPGPEMVKAAQEGRIVLGGCVIGLPGQKSRDCPNDDCRGRCSMSRWFPQKDRIHLLCKALLERVRR